MTRGLSKKLQRSDQLRRKRAQAAQAWPTAPLMPQKAIPIPSAAKRAPAPLSPAHYPAKRSSLGERQKPLESVRPVGRADK
jgi:hypothetical protein